MLRQAKKGEDAIVTDGPYALLRALAVLLRPNENKNPTVLSICHGTYRSIDKLPSGHPNYTGNLVAYKRFCVNMQNIDIH